MRYLLFLFCFISSCTLLDNKTTSEVVRFSDLDLLCDDYGVDASEYSFNAPIAYNLKFIEYASDKLSVGIDHAKLIEFANKGNHRYTGFNSINIYFEFNGIHTEVLSQLKNKSVRYRDLLNNTWKKENKESIIVIILPDDVSIYEGKDVLGAALGIPPLKGNNRAKPIMFIKKSLLYTGVFFHELSHIFGLQHIFKDDDQLNKGYNCTQGDMAVDTPTPPIGSGVSQLCKYVPGSDSDSTTIEDRIIMSSNYMGYIGPHCMRKWEVGQTQIMRKVGYTQPLLEQTRVYILEDDIFIDQKD